VAEQRSHCCCPALTPPAQRRVGEIPHDGAAGRAATLRLGVYLGEEIVWEGDHDLCHENQYTQVYPATRWGKKWGKKPHRFQPIST
jgi:hypothetical protein